MDWTINAMTMADYDDVLALWKASEGVGLSEADSPAGIARFLERNPGLAFTARTGGQVVGAVLCGDDGRRGYLHHLAVAAAFRRQGLGQELVERCLDALRRRGVRKCHIFVYAANTEGMRFWERIAYKARKDLVIMSREIEA